MAFQNFSTHARVWVYQANRTFSEAEIVVLNTFLSNFVSQWTAHEHALTSAYHIFSAQFIVLAVDESDVMASGCSIDKSVAAMKNIEKMLNVSLFDRTNFAFKAKNGDIFTVKMQDIKTFIAKEEITAETLFFDNTIQTKNDLDTKWCLPAKNTWLSRYFEKVV